MRIIVSTREAGGTTDHRAQRGVNHPPSTLLHLKESAAGLERKVIEEIGILSNVRAHRLFVGMAENEPTMSTATIWSQVGARTALCEGG